MTNVQLWSSAVYENLSRSEVLKETWLYPQAQFKLSQENKAMEGDKFWLYSKVKLNTLQI